MPKRTAILTDGAILDFVGMLPDKALRARVEKTIRDFYRADHPAREVATIRRKHGTKKR